MRNFLRAVAIIMAVIVILCIIILLVAALACYLGLGAALVPFMGAMTVKVLIMWTVGALLAATAIGLVCDQATFSNTVKKLATKGGKVIKSVMDSIGTVTSSIWIPLVAVGVALVLLNKPASK